MAQARGFIQSGPHLSHQEDASQSARLKEISTNLLPNEQNSTAKALLAQEHAEKTQRQQVVQVEITKMTAPQAVQQAGFWSDILSDETGISFHRFQIFTWTIILAIIFIDAVYTELALPDFNKTLLALMGISSGTYIGFKIPEKT